MPIRNINEGRNTTSVAYRLWSDGRPNDVMTVVSRYQGYEHVTSVTPNYHQILSSGGVLPNRPLHWAKSDWRSCEGTLTFTDTRPGKPDATYIGPQDIGSWAGNPGNFAEPTSSDWGALEARARARILSKIKNTNVNLSQMFAERQQTVNLIASTAKNMAKAMSLLRRGQFSRAANALGVPTLKGSEKKFSQTFSTNPASAASSGWLQLQYGWQPLLSDVYGSALAIAEAPFRKSCGTVRTEMTSDISEKSLTWSTDGSLSKDRIASSTLKVKMACTYQYSNPDLHDAASLGLTNPALLAWELLPYSFVVDWIVPIGSAISNLDATVGCDFVSGFTVKVLEQNVSTTVRGKGRLTTFSDGNYQDYSGTQKGSKWRKQIDLAPDSQFPAAAFPSFKNPLSTNHMFTALALLQTAFKR